MIQTKLCTPKISKDVVRRKKIEEKLALLPKYRLALVSAPAGYGKTTSVVSFLEKASVKYAWLSIDEADNDPVRFWNYIKASLSSIVGDEKISGLSINPELVSSNIAIDLLINILNEIPEDIILVLDDYHLIDNRIIINSVEYFVKYRPPKLSIIILSRQEPVYGFSKLCCRETAIRLGMKDLAFSTDETAELFSQRGVHLGSAEITALEKCTEGWAAGLVAASFSIRDGEKAGDSVNSFSGKNHNIDDMLENEVFGKWPADVRDFLTYTAFLDKLTGPLCLMVSGNERSTELLKKLSETNSFIIPLDHNNTWYRYHHLFQEFLMQKLEAKSKSVRRSLFGLAGQWYQENGYIQDSINCYLKAEEYEKAFPLVWDIYLEVAQNGEYSLWRKWIESMPQELCESDVRACTGYSWILSIENQVEEAELWADKAMACFERIKGSLAESERDYLEAHIMLAYVNAAIFRSDADSIIRYYGRIYQLAVKTPVFVGEMNSGEPNLLETAYGFKGRLNKVTGVYESIIEDAPRVLGDFSAYFSAVLAECFYEKNELKKVYSTLLKCVGRISALRNPGIIVPCFITLAKLKKARGNLNGALDIIEAGRKVLDADNTVWSYFFNVFTSELYINRGDAGNASKWLNADRLGIFDALSVSRELEYKVFAEFLILTGRLDEAMILLGRLEDFAKREDRLGSRIWALCQKAICADRLGEAKISMDALHEALELGFNDGYARTFADLNRPMSDLLTKYKSWVKETGKNKYLEYSKRLLKLTRENIKLQNAAGLQKSEKDDNNPVKGQLSERESVVLKLMVEELSNQEIAERLFITVRTVKYYNARIFDKLGVNNRLEAIIKARSLGFDR
ncbi:MAG: LuxR C-terminal-related transcriptional regulator [Bacillota bacterium]|nr:LuxR C-terminal-related transcriptional regulator [Bacillota bacterium]